MSVLKKILRLCIAFGVFALFAGMTGWITLMIMTAGGDVSIPDITGKDLKASLGLLQSEQLYLVLDGEEFHNNAPRGIVIGQNPPSGEVRKAFSTVRVILSAGPERLEMPDFRGFGLRQARSEMKNLNAGAFKEYYIHHQDYAEGEIVAHSPGPDEVIVPGSDIALLVSKGESRERYKMPDLIGLTIRESRGLLKSFQSQLDIIISDRREFGPGIVIGQDPLSGSPLSPLDRIKLTVTAEQEKVAGTPSLFTWQVPRGFLKKGMIITYTVDGNSEILMEREVDPAEEVVLYVPNTGHGVLEITLDGESVFSEVR